MKHKHSKKCSNGGASLSSFTGSSNEGGSTNSARQQLVINNQDLILEHFLPSFEMHNYMFNRTLLDTEYIRDQGAFPPPTYEEQAFQQATTSNLTGPPDQVSPDARVARFVDPTINPDMLVLNNLDTLQTLNLPIKLTVVLTKKLPLRNVRSEREMPLKVYKPGDIVTGYTLIENLSKDPIPFEMFLVSLEGTATTENVHSTDNKLTRNSFLKMYDLCACHHYGCIDVGSAADRYYGEVCPETGAKYGINDDKILRPGETYKKLFMFKIPSVLLDTACEHQSPEHLALPSSFGIDVESFKGDAGRIEVDKSFGYGHLGCVGSPVKTNDLSNYGQSIAYSINVRMIGRHLDFYKQFYTNNTDHDFDFIFIRDVQHFFRVSTSGEKHDNNTDSAWYFKSNFSSDEQVEQLDSLCANITENLQLKRDLIVAGVTDPSEQQTILEDSNNDSKKIHQLESVHSQVALPESNRLKPVKSKDKNVVENVTAATLTKGLFNKIVIGEVDITVSTNKKNSIDSIVPEVLERMSVSYTATKSAGINCFDVIQQNNSSSSKSTKSDPSSKSKSSSKSTDKRPENKKPESIFESINTIFSSTNTSFSRSSRSVKRNNNSSTLKDTTKLSRDSLGLRLLRSNRGSTNTIPSSISTSSSSSNSPITSSLQGRSASHEFKIDITFNPSHHNRSGSSSSLQPPTSIKIKPRLQVLTIQSDKPIPITIDGEFLMESSALQTAKSKIDSLKRRLLNKYLTTWSRLSSETEGQLRVPKNVYQDLLALVRMQLDLPCGPSGGIDMFETVECKDLEWSKDPSDVHHAQLTFKLFLDENKLKRTTGDVNAAAGLVHLVPSFQTCLLGRFYAVRFEFEYGSEDGKFGVKDGKKVFASLPIDVV
ncbi:unnamed protein product [Ambrosiozyma monospora]|uniref:Unnamed protein product n=1 Tax=Ambrosiozyma monospora TaxID=43982 RepID=A0ACB5SS55_AMBMO|nr:unnamed protein product [Ambrosiozyma monospora]